MILPVISILPFRERGTICEHIRILVCRFGQPLVVLVARQSFLVLSDGNKLSMRELLWL
jgi:hypothetical protein